MVQYREVLHVNVQAAAEPATQKELYGELGRLAESAKTTPPFQVGTYKTQAVALLPSKIRHEFIVQLFRAGDIPDQRKTPGSIGIVIAFDNGLGANVKFVRYSAGPGVVENHEVRYRFQSMTLRSIVAGLEDIFQNKDDLGGIGAQLRGEINAAAEPSTSTPSRVFSDLIKLIQRRSSLVVRTHGDEVTLTAPADDEIHVLARNNLFYVSLSGDRKHVRVHRSGVGEAQSLTKCPTNARDLAADVVKACLADASERISAATEPPQDPREVFCAKLMSRYGLELDPKLITYMGRDGIDYSGNVYWDRRNLTRIPVKFRKVNGYFSVSQNQLTTLENAPGHVGGDFYCSYNYLTSLEHAPGHVGGDFQCNNNHLPLDTKKPKGVKGKFILGDQWPAAVRGAAEPAIIPRGWIALIKATEKNEIDFNLSSDPAEFGRQQDVYSIYIHQPIYVGLENDYVKRELIAEVRHNYGRGAETKDVIMKLVQHQGMWLCSCRINTITRTVRVPDTSNTQACATAILVGVGVIPRDVIQHHVKAAAEPETNREDAQIRKIVDIIFAVEHGRLRGVALKGGKLNAIGKIERLALPSVDSGKALGYYELCVDVSAFLHMNESDRQPMRHLRYRVSWHQSKFQSLHNTIPEKMIVDIHNMNEDNSVRKPKSVPMPKLPSQFLQMPVEEAAKVLTRASIQLVENNIDGVVEAAAEPTVLTFLHEPADALAQFRILHKLWKEKGGDAAIARDKATALLLSTGAADDIPEKQDTKDDVHLYVGRQATPAEQQEHGSDFFDYATVKVTYPRGRTLTVEFWVWDDHVTGNDTVIHVLGRTTAETLKMILDKAKTTYKER